MGSEKTSQTLRHCEETLATARFGLEDLKGFPNRKLAGFRNLVVFGRAVTNVLQNLRSSEPRFDEWYSPFKEEMKQDPLMKYFYKLRSEILKEGALNVSCSAYIKQLNLPQDLEKFGPPPPNAKGFFIGDQSGGAGWVVMLEDGSTVKYYIDLPGDIAVVTLHLGEAPREHLGGIIKNNDIVHLGELYIAYLEVLVDKAKTTFAK